MLRHLNAKMQESSYWQTEWSSKALTTKPQLHMEKSRKKGVNLVDWNKSVVSVAIAKK